MRFFAVMNLGISVPPVVMWGNADYLNSHDVGLHGVDDAPLLVQARRPETLPIAGQRLIAEALDDTEALRTREHGYVFPFFVALQDFDRNAPRREFLVRLPVLQDLPHATLLLDHIYTVKRPAASTAA